MFTIWPLLPLGFTVLDQPIITWVELLACFFANQQCKKMPPIEVAKENSA